MSNITIRNIKTILTAPSDVNLVAVKVETSEPGLYGLGCGTFTQRYEAVATAVNEYLKPLLIGKSVDNIEDIWQLSMGNSYWRNGPVLNNAISGVDEALWDIKGKMANMPVYELLGGKCRPAAAVYLHVNGETPEEVAEMAQKIIEEQGYRYIRCQIGLYGGKIGAGRKEIFPEGIPEGAYYDPVQYMKNVVKMFDCVRRQLGDEIELIHDIHERLTPINALQLAKALEPYHLFYLEDALPPEQTEWFKMFRAQTAVPIAVGELFNNPLEWKWLISNQMIDFIRVHISQIGGLTPARKLAAFSEAFGVRTAWHGPPDITPVGVAAHLHLDLVSPNFGIQEFCGFSEQTQEVFSGCPVMKNGYLYANDRPGFGIEINEAEAAKYPCRRKDEKWLRSRLPDGTSVRP